jgi:putative spermidine/putrescine transport system ATP-binding protein
MGTPEDLYERPRTTFVADFLGESNIFRGTFTRDGGNAAVSGPGWRIAGRNEDGNLQPGTAAALIVRPDKISLGENGALRRPGTERLTGRVRQVVYLGGSLKYELDALGAVVYARIPAQGSAFAPLPGTEVALEWRSEDGIIVAD